MPRVSLILTVKNEQESIARLFESIRQQTRLPDQIVCVDGGSTDETIARLKEWTSRLPLEVLVRPGANISQGRNKAIQAATGEVIAATDAGVILDPHWLEELVQPFAAATAGAPAPDVVAGFFLPEPHGIFEWALAATTLPAQEDIRPDSFLPSSRSIAFRKRTWEQVGGYPEWLDYSEDLVFDLALRAEGARFAWAPGARVYFRPRPTLGSFFRQYYRYARGDGKADLWFKRHLLRYAAYGIALPLLLAALARGMFLPALVAGGLGFGMLFFTPYKRLATWARGQFEWHGRGFDTLRAALWIPVIRVTGDTAKMVGYPVGRVWRLQHGARVLSARAR